MRTFYVWIVSAVVGATLAGIYFTAGAETAVQAPAPEPAPMTLASAGTGVTDDPRADIDTFGGPDGPVKLSDDPRVSAGVCRQFGDDDNVEPLGLRFIQVCVPMFGPNGTILTGRIWEDGSAPYGTADDPDMWSFDPETLQFLNLDTLEYFQG